MGPGVGRAHNGTLQGCVDGRDATVHGGALEARQEVRHRLLYLGFLGVDIGLSGVQCRVRFQRAPTLDIRFDTTLEMGERIVASTMLCLVWVRAALACSTAAVAPS
jgi:hypothetical protein